MTPTKTDLHANIGCGCLLVLLSTLITILTLAWALIHFLITH